MGQISSGLNIFFYQGPETVLATASWRTNVTEIHQLNVARNGWLSYLPGNQYPAVTSLQPGRFYLLNATTAFELNGATFSALNVDAGEWHIVYTEAERDAIGVTSYLHTDKRGSGLRRVGMHVVVATMGAAPKLWPVFVLTAPANYDALTDAQKLAALGNNANWLPAEHLAFTPIAENQYNVHPEFRSQNEMNAWILTNWMPAPSTTRPPKPTIAAQNQEQSYIEWNKNAALTPSDYEVTHDAGDTWSAATVSMLSGPNSDRLRLTVTAGVKNPGTLGLRVKATAETPASEWSFNTVRLVVPGAATQMQLSDMTFIGSWSDGTGTSSTGKTNNGGGYANRLRIDTVRGVKLVLTQSKGFNYTVAVDGVPVKEASGYPSEMNFEQLFDDGISHSVEVWSSDTNWVAYPSDSIMYI